MITVNVTRKPRAVTRRKQHQNGHTTFVCLFLRLTQFVIMKRKISVWEINGGEVNRFS